MWNMQLFAKTVGSYTCTGGSLNLRILQLNTDLDEFQGPARVIHQLSILHIRGNGCLQLWVASLVQSYAREEVVDE